MTDFYNEDLKVLNFTHIDFDGVTAGIVIKNYFKNVITEQINYGQEPQIIDKLKKYQAKFEAVIFTDFCPNNIREIQNFCKTYFPIEIPVLVLDHHESAKEYDSPSTGVYINQKYSGCMLAYKYFGIKKDLTHLKELVTIANDYDLFTLADKRSMFYNALSWEMGFKWFFARFLHGNITLYPEEKEWIQRYVQEVKKQYDELPISDLAHKGCFYECDRYLAEMSVRLSKAGYDYQIIKHGNSLSLRSNTDKIDLVEVCRIVGKGGGHKRAAGVPIYYGEDIQKLVEKICYAVEHTINYGGDDGLPF